MVERYFFGFEDGEGNDLSVKSVGIIADGTARSGDFHFSAYAPVSQTRQVRRSLTHTFTCPANGDEVRAAWQVAARVRMYPTAANCPFFGFSIGTTVGPNQDCRVLIQPSGLITLSPNNAATAVNSSFVIALDTWYVYRLEWVYQRNDAGSDPYAALLTVYEGASMDTIPTVIGTVLAQGVDAMGGFQMLGQPCLGANVGFVRIIDYDDWWFAVADEADAHTQILPGGALEFPGGSRIAPVLVIQQDGPAQWTGSVDLVRDVPNSAVAGNEQTSATSGITTNFQHDSASEIGLLPGFTGGGSLPYQLVRSTILAAPVIQVFTLPGGGTFANPVWVYVTQIADDGTGTKESDPSEKILVDASSLPAIYIGIDSTTFGAYGGVFRCYVTNAYSARGVFDSIANANGLCATLNQQPFLAKFIDTTTAWATASGLTPTPTPPLPAYLAVWVDADSQGTLFYPYQYSVVGQSTVVVGAVKVLPQVKRTAGAGTVDVMLANALLANVVTSNAYGTNQAAYSWSPATEDEFNGLIFGVRTTDAAATQLGNILMEVMTGGDLDDCSNLDGQYQQQCGIFTSNGGFQSIAVPFLNALGVAVPPTFVMIKRIGATASTGGVKMWWMGGTQSWPINSVTPESIAIMRLTPAGFDVGPSQNANGITGGAATYAYVAVRDGMQDVVNGGYMVCGSYQRSGTTDGDKTVEITGPSVFLPTWAPDTVMVFGSSVIVHTQEMGAAESLSFGTAAAILTNGIVSQGANAFTTGGNNGTDLIGQYPYAAWRFDADGLLETVFQTGSFAGNNAVQVIPTNFMAEFIMLDHLQAGYSGRFRSNRGNTGNNSVPWPGGAVTTTDITAIGAADFTVGVGASVTGQTSYWLAWKLNGAFGNAGDNDDPPPDDDRIRGTGNASESDPSDDPLCPTPVVPSPV